MDFPNAAADACISARPRRVCTGELIQTVGGEHHRFEDRGPACTLLFYVDDATSRLMQLLFVSSESIFTYFEATRRYLERYDVLSAG